MNSKMKWTELKVDPLPTFMQALNIQQEHVCIKNIYHSWTQWCQPIYTAGNVFILQAAYMQELYWRLVTIMSLLELGPVLFEFQAWPNHFTAIQASVSLNLRMLEQALIASTRTESQLVGMASKYMNNGHRPHIHPRKHIHLLGQNPTVTVSLYNLIPA